MNGLREKSGHPHLDRQPQRVRRSLNLVKPRGMTEVKQPVHLRHMPTQAASQFGFANSLLRHGLIYPQLGALKSTGPHTVFWPRLGLLGTGSGARAST